MAKSLLTPKSIAATIVVTLVLLASLYAFHRLEQFLIRDPRFTFVQPRAQPGGAELAAGGDSLAVTGATHVSPQAIEAVFADDFGRSAYLVPLDDRRASLRTVDWVKDASVARFWPNRLVVGVTERTPVALIAQGSGRPALIDQEGVILPPVQERFTLPVLVGVRASDPLPQRRERVQRLQRLMKELGDASRVAAEVDVSDPDDVKMTEPFDGRMVTLLLGDHNFALRHSNFVRYYAEIRKKMPGAAMLDLRVEDRITVVPQTGVSQTASSQAVTQ
jgi:cell division protein FtsQ